MPACYNADAYFQGPSLTLTQVLLLPKQPSLRDGRENTCPFHLPPNTQRRQGEAKKKKKKKRNLILCYKMNKGLDQHQVAPLGLMVSLHFSTVLPSTIFCLTWHIRRQLFCCIEVETAVLFLRSGCITKGQTKQN